MLSHIQTHGLYPTRLLSSWDFPDKNIGESSIQFSCSVVSDSATPWIEHPRPPCPSPTPGVYSSSCPSSRWCHPATSSSVIPFSSCPQSLPVSRSFPMSQLFTWGGQSIGEGSHSLLQGIFLTQWSNLGLLHCRPILYCLSHQGSPKQYIGNKNKSSS